MRGMHDLIKERKVRDLIELFMEKSGLVEKGRLRFYPHRSVSVDSFVRLNSCFTCRLYS